MDKIYWGCLKSFKIFETRKSNLDYMVNIMKKTQQSITKLHYYLI